MKNRVKHARESRGLTAQQLADKMNVDVSTIRNWESGRRQVSVEYLISASEILGYSLDYLLGYDRELTRLTEPVPQEKLPALHGRPAWIASMGWVLVNIAEGVFILHDMSSIPMEQISEPVYAYPPALALSLEGVGPPLNLDEVHKKDKVWVEALTIDTKLSSELRGWYHLYDGRLVQNEFGCRFYLDSYGVKWLAFEDCLE